MSMMYLRCLTKVLPEIPAKYNFPIQYSKFQPCQTFYWNFTSDLGGSTGSDLAST